MILALVLAGIIFGGCYLLSEYVLRVGTIPLIGISILSPVAQLIKTIGIILASTIVLYTLFKYGMSRRVGQVD